MYARTSASLWLCAAAVMSACNPSVPPRIETARWPGLRAHLRDYDRTT